MNDKPEKLGSYFTQSSVECKLSGFSPINLVFNFNPIDVVQSHLTAAIHANLEKDEKESFIDNRNQPLVHIASERAKCKQRFDTKHANPSIYSTANLVVVENEPVSTGESRKLEPRYRGPYVVVKALGNDRYVIEDIPGVHITARKYCSANFSTKSSRGAPTSLSLMFPTITMTESRTIRMQDWPSSHDPVLMQKH